jgi:hypothetical protein
VVGTINEEFVISSSDNKALSNTNVTILNQTAYGSKRIKPIVIDKSVLFVDGYQNYHHLNRQYSCQSSLRLNLPIIFEETDDWLPTKDDSDRMLQRSGILVKGSLNGSELN